MQICRPLTFLFAFLFIHLATAKYFLYLVNCTGNPQAGPWVGHALYNLPSAPINMEHPYDITIAFIGAAAVSSFSFEGRGDGGIMGSWRLGFEIYSNATELKRGEVAGGGTKVGDAGRPGDPFSKKLAFDLFLSFFLK